MCHVAAGGARHVLNRLQKTTIHRGRQGSLGVTSMMIQFLRHEGLDTALLLDGQAPAIPQPVGQRHRIISRAEGARFGELIRLQCPRLERDQAKQQIAVGVHGPLEDSRFWVLECCFDYDNAELVRGS